MRYTTLRARALPTCAALLLPLFGCAGTPPAFATKFPDNRDADVEQLLQRIDAAPERPAGTIAVGLSPAPQQQLFAYDLTTRSVLWQRKVDAGSAPYLAGDAVVLQSGGRIEGFDLRSGDPRFHIDRGELSLRGADGEGRRTAITLSDGLGTFARSEVVLVSNDSVQWRREVDKSVGVPAVVGTMVLVPWSNQFLSAIDVATGDEFARVRVRDGVIGHALRDGSVYIGSYHGIARVTSSVGSGALKGPGFFALPSEELPGRALLLPDVYTQSAPAPSEGAQHRIALAWRPTAPDHVRIALQDGNLYLVFYRFVFALDPASYEPRWVYIHDADIVGSGAQVNGIAIADEAGKFGFIGAVSGQPLWSAASRMPSAVVRLPHGGGGASDGGAALPEGELAARLLAAALDPDARLVPARLLAVEALARLQEADATANLIELCDTPRAAPPVRERACAKLKDRAIGADYLLKALERHYGFLEGTTVPPVGALAKAAASLKETRAVPLLIAHLKDPNTRSSDLPALVAALGQLGDSAAGEPLADFFQMYHADPIDEHVVAALDQVPAALLALSGPVAKPVLESVTYDELGAPSVRLKANAALDTLIAQQQAAEKSDEEKQVEQEQQAAAETAEAEAVKPPPTHLSFELISEALLPVRDQLRACLKTAAKPTYQARMLLAIEEGEAKMVSILPAELQSCVEPLARGQKYPRTKTGKREQVTYVIKR